MSRITEIPGRLYRGEVSINFVGHARRWYTISGAILLVSVVSLLVRGLNFSVDFKGGSIVTFKAAASTTLAAVQNVLAAAHLGNQATAQSVGSGGFWQVTMTHLNTTQVLSIEGKLTNALQATKFNTQFIGPTWGSQISGKAGEALVIFLIVIVIYLSIAFEWKMASAAFVALIHDIVITIGVYSLCGFTVSPASVIGLLTILGYSLYDTVVVFDKVRENTAGLLGSSKSNYSQAANLALNQTLVRSINTSLIALLPVAAILFIGGALLPPGELQDLSLVLFVGMMSGTYSSIFIATPVLANLKEREHQYKVLAKRVALREAGGRSALRAAAKGAKSAPDASTGPAAGGGVGAATAVADPASGPTINIGRGYDGEPEDLPETDDQDAELDGTDRVPAGRSAPNGVAPHAGIRPGPRQQPRRTTAAKRRPGGKKKKR